MINKKIILTNELTGVKITHHELQRFFNHPQRFEKSATPEKKYALSRAIAHEYIRFSLEQENGQNYFTEDIDNYEIIKPFVLMAVFNLDSLLYEIAKIENNPRRARNKQILALATTEIFGKTLHDLCYWMIQGRRRVPGDTFNRSSFERMAALHNIDEMLIPYLNSLAQGAEKDQ